MKTELRSQGSGLRLFVGVAVVLCAVVAFAETDHSWLKRVSDKDRQRTNPYAGSADAVAAGQKVYGQYCSTCHGKDLEGNGKKPTNQSRLDLNLDGWAFEGLVPKRVMQLPSTTTLERAPKKLAEVLRQMSEGGTARVWLSAKDAKEIAPVAGDRELIVDVTLSKIE